MAKRCCDQDDELYYASKRRRQEPLRAVNLNLQCTPQRQRMPPQQQQQQQQAESLSRGAPQVGLRGWAPCDSFVEGRPHPTLATTPPPQPYEEPFAFVPPTAFPANTMTGGFPVALPLPPLSSRSPSVCTNTTEGLSEDSIFSTDAANVHFRHRSHHYPNPYYKDRDCCGLGVPPSSADMQNVCVARGRTSSQNWNTDAQKWQNELNAFFSRLDERPLRVAKD